MSLFASLNAHFPLDRKPVLEVYSIILFSAGVLPGQGIGEGNPTVTFGKIMPVDFPNLFQVRPKGLFHDLRQ
ncbi:MAG: hypothetical protein KAJ81_06320 [Candidatus Latescibacteria bacterium]|nr:hypothetical protein [Candidatus Latescibacterota bacterium]